MDCKKTCGGCVHFHQASLPKKRVNGVVYKNGRCGLGFHDDTDEACRIFKDRDAPKDTHPLDSRRETDEIEQITGYKGRFTKDVWSRWMKKTR